MRYIIVDLEATCWERDRHQQSRMETIEIGAVLMADADAESTEEFSVFIKPVREPKLSDFCTELTTITQADVDGAAPFPIAFRQFLEWIGPEPFIWCSWGAYDRTQLKQDCKNHGMAYPQAMERHLNLKPLFVKKHNNKRCGMKKAMEILGLEATGTHHRGIDDARNIAKIARTILPHLDTPPERLFAPAPPVTSPNEI